MNGNECCGKCKYHEYEDTDGWVCVNPDSDYCGWTEYNDYCEEFEER